MGFQIWLAPLRGVTDTVFRNVYAEFFSGIDLAITPFISTTRGPRIKSSHLKEVLPENNRKMPVIPQVMSKRAENFIPMATALLDMGYPAVNWNLGCPYPMVAKKGRGSGLLADPQAIERFLDAVSAVMPEQLSIKMRLGRHQEDEIFELLPILDRYPLKEVIIHPRTGVQMYEGKPHLDIFEQCLGLCRHEIIYNGDIVDIEGFRGLRKRFPQIGAWMIGRGAVADPFLCGVLKGVLVDENEKNRQFRAFHDALYVGYARKLYGPSHLISRMKGLWAYFHTSFEEGTALRKKINKSRNPKHFEEIVNDFFEKEPKWRSNMGGEGMGNE